MNDDQKSLIRVISKAMLSVDLVPVERIQEM